MQCMTYLTGFTSASLILISTLNATNREYSRQHVSCVLHSSRTKKVPFYKYYDVTLLAALSAAPKVILPCEIKHKITETAVRVKEDPSTIFTLRGSLDKDKSFKHLEMDYRFNTSTKKITASTSFEDTKFRDSDLYEVYIIHHSHIFSVRLRGNSINSELAESLGSSASSASDYFALEKRSRSASMRAAYKVTSLSTVVYIQ